LRRDRAAPGCTDGRVAESADLSGDTVEGGSSEDAFEKLLELTTLAWTQPTDAPRQDVRASVTDSKRSLSAGGGQHQAGAPAVRARPAHDQAVLDKPIHHSDGRRVRQTQWHAQRLDRASRRPKQEGERSRGAARSTGGVLELSVEIVADRRDQRAEHVLQATLHGNNV